MRPMAMGKAKEQEGTFWIATHKLAKGPGHPFYKALNRILSKHGFDEYVESLCGNFYAEKLGRPSLPPTVYFRLLLIGYFEGLDSERGIAWRVADSLTLREFLGYELERQTPDHSTVSRNRRLIDEETHEELFLWVLQVLAKEGLLKGKTLGVDATTLEANAALRSIVRRDTGESYQEFLMRLAKASGIETPTREDLAKLDRKRKGKGSNKDWRHPHDPDAKIAKMKDGRTHLAHKAEHAVDMQSGAVVAVTVQPANRGDTDSIEETLASAVDHLVGIRNDEEAGQQLSGDVSSEVVTDKGYHSNRVVSNSHHAGMRTYISEPKRGRRKWKGKPAEQEAVYANRRRIRGEHGKRLLRKRGEIVERCFAHCYDTGGMRRTHLRGHSNILKRLFVHVGGFNLSLVLRKALGAGTPREIKRRLRVSFSLVLRIWRFIGVRYVNFRAHSAISDYAASHNVEFTPRPLVT